MPLETATYITSLVITNPDGSDQKNTADDHIRLIKACLKRSWPLIDGAVSLSHTQLMRLADVSASVQAQINALRDGSATANNALFANSASFATNANNALSLGGVAASTFTRRDTNLTISAQWTFQIAGSGGETVRFAGTNSYLSFYNATNTTRYGYLQMVAGADMWLVNETSAAGFRFVTTGGGTMFTFNNNAIWHAGNDGPDSGLNADLLDGMHAVESAIGSTVVARNVSGYVFAVYFNQSSSESENPNVNSIFVSNGDGYMRKATPAYLGTLMQTRNITGKSGTAKTISSTSPAGGSDGDIWYQI